MKSESPKKKPFCFKVEVYGADMIGSTQQIDGSNNISASKLHLSKAVTCSHAR